MWLQILDIICVIGLFSLAMLALRAKGVFTAIAWFIIFGLFMSLVLVRLRAPDVALAEAAIGAGLTGALFVTTWHSLRAEGANDDDQ